MVEYNLVSIDVALLLLQFFKNKMGITHIVLDLSVGDRGGNVCSVINQYSFLGLFSVGNTGGLLGMPPTTSQYTDHVNQTLLNYTRLVLERIRGYLV